MSKIDVLRSSFDSVMAYLAKHQKACALLQAKHFYEERPACTCDYGELIEFVHGESERFRTTLTALEAEIYSKEAP